MTLTFQKMKDLGEVGEQTEKKHIHLTFDLDDLDLLKNEPLKLISEAALHLPSRFGEDRPKDLGGNRKKHINLTFDLDTRQSLTQLDP